MEYNNPGVGQFSPSPPSKYRPSWIVFSCILPHQTSSFISPQANCFSSAPNWRHCPWLWPLEGHHGSSSLSEVPFMAHDSIFKVTPCFMIAAEVLVTIITFTMNTQILLPRLSNCLHLPHFFLVTLHGSPSRGVLGCHFLAQVSGRFTVAYPSPTLRHRTAKPRLLGPSGFSWTPCRFSSLTP